MTERKTDDEADFFDLGDELANDDQHKSSTLAPPAEPTAPAGVPGATPPVARPGATPRTLYRPPSASDLPPSRPARQTRLAPEEDKRAAYSSDFDDDDEGNVTRIAAIPTELIEALNAEKAPASPPAKANVPARGPLPAIPPAPPPRPKSAYRPPPPPGAPGKMPPPAPPPRVAPPAPSQPLAATLPPPASAERETVVHAPSAAIPAIDQDLDLLLGGLVPHARDEAPSAVDISLDGLGDDDDEDVIFVAEDDGDEEVALEGDDADPHDADTPPHGVPASAPTPAQPSASAPDRDRGAAAAKRTVRTRRKRAEVMPLVGSGPDVLQARRELLVHLADRTAGDARARLLSAAAELDEARHEPTTAHALLERAAQAAPEDLHVLRALRRHALGRGDTAAATRLAERELPRLPNGEERATTLTLLAELGLRAGDDPAEAEAYAREAQALRPGSLIAPLLLAEALDRRGEPAAAGDALAAAADALPSGALRASLLTEAAQRAERAGSSDAASERFERALETNEATIGAALGAARHRLRRGERAAAAEAIDLARTHAAAARRGLAQARARLASAIPNEGAAVAAALLEGSSSGHALLARAAASRAAGSMEGALDAYREAAERLEGRARAIALVGLAELEAERGALRGADEALREAAADDPSLTNIPALRELLSQRACAPAELPPASLTSERDEERYRDAIRAAASGALEDEQQALTEVAARAPILAEVLGVDVAAAARDQQAVLIGLRAKADRRPPALRVGPLLSLAHLHALVGDHASAEAALREARELSPGDPLVLRPLSKLVERDAPLEAASMLLEESSVGVGDQSAFAASAAGRLLERTGADPSLAYRRALQSAPGYPAAVLGLLPLLESRGETAELRNLHRSAARRLAGTPTGRAHLLAALELSTNDPSAFATLLDAVDAPEREAAALLELALIAGDGLPEASLATMLRADAGPLPEAVERARQSALDRLSAGASSPGAPEDAAADLSAVADLSRTDLPTLRALERTAMDRGAEVELAAVEAELAKRLDGSGARSGAARLAGALTLVAGGDLSALDLMWTGLAHLADAPADTLARAAAAATRRSDPSALIAAATALVHASDAPSAQQHYALRATEAMEHLNGSDDAAELLTSLVAEAPTEPLVAEALAALHAKSGRPREAADALEAAAEQATSAVAKARLWYGASALWLDGCGDAERALLALEATTRADIAYRDAYERARELLIAKGDLPRAIALTKARIDAGGEPTTVARLEAERADLADRLGDAATADEAFERALALAPDDVATLRGLAELQLRRGRYENAADALIRVARQSQDRGQLRWAFLALGDIYDVHLPDPKRADIAFRRVLRLSPGDEVALGRLTRLALTQGDLEAAEASLAELLTAHPRSTTAREQSLALATGFEVAGDGRRAEETLERIRKVAPTDLSVVGALTALYRRQGAQSALSMHLGRASADLRRELDDEPTRADSWAALAEVLAWAGTDEDAQCVAMAARSLGVQDLELARRLPESGGLSPLRFGPLVAAIEERVAPAELPSTTRRVVRAASPLFDKVLPFDPRAFQAERIRNHPLLDEIDAVARSLDVSSVQVLFTDLSPRVAVPVSDSPVLLVVGKQLASVTTASERAFLFARALFIAKAGLSIALRVQPEILGMLIGSLTAIYEPSHAPAGISRASLEDTQRRLLKAMPRRLKGELEPLCVDLAGGPPVDPHVLGLTVAELGNRLALLATGSLEAALSALLRLAGGDLGEPTPANRLPTIGSMPEALSLFHFAISETHFAARRAARGEESAR